MTRMLQLVAAAAGVSLVAAADGASWQCSSLNGPYCGAGGAGFAAAPAYAALNLDRDEEEAKQNEVDKQVKIESVLKQYELQAAESPSGAALDIVVDIEMLLDESSPLLGSDLEDEEANPLAGAFAFSSEDGAFEQLEQMDGQELKEFFELALDEVLESVEVALQDLSPEAAQGVRTTARQLKEVVDVAQYSFRRLDATLRASVRRKFANHRLVELQQTFERLVIARTAQDRQLAFETAIYLFQLAQEEATAKAATSSTESKERTQEGVVEEQTADSEADADTATERAGS